ncbi:alpha/beta hydrolase [Brachyspira aalborgi]|nr:alpha/beta hydrolase [Brachyspira aalborgi]
MLKKILTIIITVFALIGCNNNQNNEQINANQSNQSNQNKTEEEMGYISELNENVTRTKVTYKNRYGLYVAADLYYLNDIDKTKKYPAIIVGAPYGGVKEQGPSVYGNELALRGFVVLAFDQSFMGESGGFPRNVSSPDIFVENFSASVDYLGLQEFVDREKIGVIGICGSAGFSLSAAQTDTRIKAITVVSGGDVSASRDFLSKEDLQKAKERLSLQRWVDAENGYPEYIPFFPEEPLEEVPANLEEPMSVWFRFYALKRGHHTNALGGFTTTSGLSMMNFRLLDFIDEISPRPILFVIGDRAHSRSSSEGIYRAAAEPKEIYIVEDADHIDLYDRVDRIPFDKLEDFFNTNLK